VSMFRNILDAIETDWQTTTARPEQLPPQGDDWLIWVILAGRGWGKSFTGAHWVISQAEAWIGPIALVGSTSNDVRNVMVEGVSGILALSRDDFRPNYEPSKNRLTWPNGVFATLFSAEEYDRLRGFNHAAAWLDEFAAWKNLAQTWEQLQLTLRVGARPRVVITTTPRPVPVLKALVKRAAEGDDVVLTRGRTLDNAANLAKSFLEDIHKQFGGTRRGRQELDAEILDDTPGALWTRDLIEKTRVDPISPAKLKRIVVAIDPAVSVGEGANETGIVVAGIGHNGEFYVIADLSGKYLPNDWATRAVGAYRHYSADRIVAESNQGGALVESTIRAVDRNVPVRLVHASKGKILRAEPVSALFEQGRAHLAGTLPELEDQLCAYEAGTPGSPDRLDAMVWALTELMRGGGAVVHFTSVGTRNFDPGRARSGFRDDPFKHLRY
jgi:predicted phage terminase large subunit-like protein